MEKSSRPGATPASGAPGSKMHIAPKTEAHIRGPATLSFQDSDRCHNLLVDLNNVPFRQSEHIKLPPFEQQRKRFRKLALFLNRDPQLFSTLDLPSRKEKLYLLWFPTPQLLGNKRVDQACV